MIDLLVLLAVYINIVVFIVVCSYNSYEFVYHV